MAGKLTNKFTKSVLEREQKELHEKKGTDPIVAPETGGAGLAVQKQEAAALPLPAVPLPAVAEPLEQRAPAAPKAEPQKRMPKLPAQQAPDSLEVFLVAPQNRRAKNKTFYLDAAVIDALKAAATAHQVAESKLVNDILKKVLGV